MNAQRQVIAVAAMAAMAGCSTTAPTKPNATLTGDWALSISAAPSCDAILPAGYGVAPRGGGRAALVQSGTRLSGTLYIFDSPSGSIEGTVQGSAVNFKVELDGRNVGVRSPADEPCRVSGAAVGATDGYCSINVKIAGELACPYSCLAEDHLWLSIHGRGCQ
jgi:hypothetical protein